MKRLHPVAEREQTVAQGAYTYFDDGGEEMGIGEAWELARLPDGSGIYRADIGEGRELWHLMRAPDGYPDRIQVRLRDEAGRRFDVTCTFFPDEAVITRSQVGKQTEQRVVSLQPGYGLLWEPCAGRELALAGYDAGNGVPQTVNVYWVSRLTPDEDWLTGRLVRCVVGRSGAELLRVPAGSFQAESFVFSASDLPDQRGWLDERGTVLRWEADGEVQAVLSRYRRFD